MSEELVKKSLLNLAAFKQRKQVLQPLEKMISGREIGRTKDLRLKCSWCVCGTINEARLVVISQKREVSGTELGEVAGSHAGREENWIIF